MIALNNKKRILNIFCHSYRGKVVISVIMLLIVFLTISFIEMYIFINQILLDKSYNFMQSEVRACSININERIERLEDVSLGIAGNSSLQDYLKIKAYEKLDKHQEYNLYNDIRKIIGEYALLYNEIDSIYIITLDGTEYMYNKYNTSNFIILMNYLIFVMLLITKKVIHIGIQKKKILFLVAE